MRFNKDLIAGVMFFAIGAGFLFASRAYEFGSIRHMGPAFFPSAVAVILMAFGVLVAISGRRTSEPMGAFALRPFVLVLGAVVLFAILLRGLGLPIAVFVLVFVSALASRRMHILSTLALAAGLAVVSSAVFVTLLGLPLPLVGDWLG